MSVLANRIVWDCAELAHGELLVMLALADAANENLECWPSLETIMLKSRMKSKSSVAKIIRNLLAMGYIKRRKRFVDGRYTTSMYKITIKRTEGIIYKSGRVSFEEEYSPDKDDELENVSGEEDGEIADSDGVVFQAGVGSVLSNTRLCSDEHLNRPLNRPININTARENFAENPPNRSKVSEDSVCSDLQETPEQYALRTAYQQRQDILQKKNGEPSIEEEHKKRVIAAIATFDRNSREGGSSAEIEYFVGKLPERIRANARMFCLKFGRPPTASERKYWISTLGTQVDIGIGVDDISDAFSEMQRRGLYIKSPASVTAIAENRKKTRYLPAYGSVEVYAGDGTRLV